MDQTAWEVLEYDGCLQSCVWGWRELYALASRRGAAAAEARALLIPACGGGGLPDTGDSATLHRIREAHRSGTVVAAVCAGSAWVAAAGIDRGRALTTHWSLAPALAALRSDVRVAASELVIDHGDLVTAGGMLAWVDLGLHLVERWWGRGVADDCARTLVWDRGRTNQTPFSPPGSAWIPLRADPALDRAVRWISARFRNAVAVDDWAVGAALGVRTLQRRWAAAFGASPLEWLQRVRVEEARRLLEETDLPWEAITRECGYLDGPSFRELFARSVGWTPGRYRRTYGAGPTRRVLTAPGLPGYSSASEGPGT